MYDDIEVLEDERLVEAGFRPREPMKKTVLAMPRIFWLGMDIVPRLDELRATVSFP